MVYFRSVLPGPLQGTTVIVLGKDSSSVWTLVTAQGGDRGLDNTPLELVHGQSGA